MQFSKYIIIVFSSLALLTSAFAKAPNEKSRVDSIYAHLGNLDRIRQLVWLSSNEEKSLPHEMYHFGGVYFEKPLQSIPQFDGVAVAVQLDDRLNPLPNELEDLPNLMTLASINDSQVLSTYFYFLKSNCKARGIDYLILPDHDLLSRNQAQLINKMEAFDGSFFKQRSSLSFEETKRKKDLMQIFASRDYWVIDQAFLAKADKGLDKVARKIPGTDFEDRVKNALSNYEADRDYTIKRLPSKLAVALSRSSVISLTKNDFHLPIKADTISLITDSPYGFLSNMLRKYAYVITDYSEIFQSETPVIIDNHSFIPPALLVRDREMIFLGEIELLRSHQMVDAALTYSQHHESLDYLLPQMLFGTTEVRGLTPYDFIELSSFQNQRIAGNKRLGYAPPEMTGIDSQALDRIKEIVSEAITSGGTPGCQVAVALDGSIILDEAYGFLTYDSLIPVDHNTLYDLASITKVAATSLAVMKLYEDGKIDIDKNLGTYLTEFDSSNKKDLTIRSVLAHHSGLKSYVPFWKKALLNDRLETFYYSSDSDQKDDIRSYGLRPDPILLDSLNNWILASPLVNLERDPFYNYSDIGFMILHQLVERVSGKPVDQYLEDEFYSKLGLTRLTFNPKNKGFELFEIAPTEYDYYFRDELVWGEVHDRNAAIFGGVSGHAGLFSNASELLVILQTLLQGGTYDGQQLLKKETIDTFNQTYYPNNRRGLGWDKKDPFIGNASRLASDQSFGHSGFTGTLIWADPAYDLIFVFLSNRIYPNSENQELIRRNIRTRIQDVVYEAILAKWLN